MKYLIYLFLFFGYNGIVHAQKNKSAALVYVDNRGVLRWQDSKKEAAFFGVNYTVPFAYGYRSINRLGIDIKKEIDRDVYHFARLGLDAFRVHVWDTEITDSSGNLLSNEHLDLYDYLLYKLEERNIKILLTPLAFWGNGYPEKDENTGSFSSIYNKQQVLINANAIKAQENYLRQILSHVNPYTKKKYGDDPNVIALEINNEPHHSGSKEIAADYINRMVVAVKNSGWRKPIVYNISESPAYADVVASSNIEGVSFQWYPTGLVANHELKGNFLPNVDQYKIPFGDTIANFANKTKMVYEFDAGDVLQSYLYPAMVRSYRQAGFQWATQFAYDPLGTAFANTEYQTHYLNLAYTPSKAISLLIASKAFHQLPRYKNFGRYPADTLFGTFRVSYQESLSEMNSNEEFYYSNSTKTNPVNISSLKHIAGVGSSPVVEYEGAGAYFLDKITDGAWRLEVMPDAVSIRDPFEKASLKKEVTRIQWQDQRMQIMLDDLQTNFEIKAINEGNDYKTTAIGTTFNITPGTYIVLAKVTPSDLISYPKKMGVIGMKEFVAPQSYSSEPFVNHIPFHEVSANRSFSITAKVVGVNSEDKLSLEIHNSANKWQTISLQKKSFCDFVASIPAEIVTAGVLNYRLIIQKNNQDFYVFPGNHKGDPYAWDNIINETWQTFVAAERTPLELFNPNVDRNNLIVHNPDWRNNSIEYTIAEKPGRLILKTMMAKSPPGQIMGWQNYVGDKIKGREKEVPAFDKIVIRARSLSADAAKLKLILISTDANSFATDIFLTNEFRDIEIPLMQFKKDFCLLLPRPYPGFLPLWFLSSSIKEFNLAGLEKLQIVFSNKNGEKNKTVGVEIESVYLKKNLD